MNNNNNNSTLLALKDNGVNNNNKKINNQKKVNKIKKQKQQKKKQLRKKIASLNNNNNNTIATTTTTTTTRATRTTETTTSNFSSPPSSSIPTNVLPIVLPSSVIESVTNSVTHNELQGISAASIAGIDNPPPSYQQSSSVKAAHIAGPIIGIFAGIAFIAGAMFLVVRNRNKRKLTTKRKIEPNDHDEDGSTFHTISLNDEAIMIPAAVIDNEKKKQSFVSVTSTMTTKNDDYHDEKKKQSYISTTNDYHSMTETLIGSSRSNSVIVNNKKQQLHESWQSNTNNSKNHVDSFLMVAERQQLQHEKPNILDHKRMPIETYKAQLADILAEEEQQQQQQIVDQPLPFISISDMLDFYYK